MNTGFIYLIVDYCIVIYYNTGMKISDMPAWVLKYKSKGYTIRFQGGQYCLLKVSSVRVKDKPYPKLIQEFIGVITEKDGLIPKKVAPSDEPVLRLELGLSAFLYTNFKREMNRHINATDFREVIITATLILFMFDTVDDRFLKLTHLPRLTGSDSFQHLNERRLNNAERLNQRIHDHLNQTIPDDIERSVLLFELRNITLPPHVDLHKAIYPQALKDKLEKWGYRYDTHVD